MAQSWTVYFSGITLTNNKNMGAILNGHATEVLRIRRVGLLNAQTASVATPVMCNLEARTYRAGASITTGTSVTPTKHDTNNTNPTTATYAHAGTLGGTQRVLRRVLWSSNEAGLSVSVTNDELETYVPMNMIWGASRNADDEVLVLRENELYTTFNTIGIFGLLDSWIEFTKDP